MRAYMGLIEAHLMSGAGPAAVLASFDVRGTWVQYIAASYFGPSRATRLTGASFFLPFWPV